MKIQTTRIYKEIEKANVGGYSVCSEQGSSRSSKTYNTLIWIIMRCLTKPGTSVSICRATLPSLKASVLRDFLEILQRLQLYEKSQYNKSEHIYRFDNGSWVEFFSCDSEQKLRGRKRRILYVNEANELRYIEWQQLQLRTEEFTIIDYNPSFTDEHWICGVNKDSRTYHFITTYKDNPFLEQRVVDEIESLQTKNKSLWQIYGLGLQAVIEGLVFENVEIVDETPQRAKRHRFLGVDYGYSADPTAIVEVCIDGDGIFVDEITYQTKLLSGNIIDILREYNMENGTDVKIISESADPRLIDEIALAGLDIHPVKKYGGSINAGIQKMQQMKIKVTRRSANVMREFNNYTYRQNKDGKWLNEPIDQFNHALDAIRYVILEEVLGSDKANELNVREIADLLF